MIAIYEELETAAAVDSGRLISAKFLSKLGDGLTKLYRRESDDRTVVVSDSIRYNKIVDLCLEWVTLNYLMDEHFDLVETIHRSNGNDVRVTAAKKKERIA